MVAQPESRQCVWLQPWGRTRGRSHHVAGLRNQSLSDPFGPFRGSFECKPDWFGFLHPWVEQTCSDQDFGSERGSGEPSLGLGGLPLARGKENGFGCGFLTLLGRRALSPFCLGEGKTRPDRSGLEPSFESLSPTKLWAIFGGDRLCWSSGRRLTGPMLWRYI